MKIRDSLKKGTVEMLLLTLLKEEDMYGYQLSQLIKEKSDNEVSFPEGSLYPALYKLSEEKYITSYEKQIGKRLKRVYYHIEGKGVEYQEHIVNEYISLHEGIQKILFDKGGDSNE